MPAVDDRWDVVVVALRDPSQAAAVMAIAELAHYASLPLEDVERLLDAGELVVLQNLDRAEAERAAYEIAELGGVADLRLTASMGKGGVYPVFKPDAERQIGVAVGGLIDDSATPPSVGESLGVPELEPDLEVTQAPRGRPARTKTPSPAQRAPQAERRPAAAPPELEDELPPPSPPRARSTAPKSARSNPGGRAPARKAAPDLESLLGDINESTAPPPAQKDSGRSLPPAGSARAPSLVEVDFEAAGIAPRTKGPLKISKPAAATTKEASDMPRRSRAGNIGGSGASAAGHSQREGGFVEALRDDGVAAVLFGLAVGLGLALILALQLQRSAARELLPPLEEELAAALNDPDGVASGKHRSPSAIEGEVEGALGDMQRSFLLWWLLPGIGVGLLLSRLRPQ